MLKKLKIVFIFILIYSLINFETHEGFKIVFKCNYNFEST